MIPIKKKIIKYILVVITVTAMVLTVMLIGYLFTTRSAQGCKDYCLENTQRNATYFTRIGDGRYTEDYAYFIAANGDSSKPQEIFVFKSKFFLGIPFDRYDFVVSSIQSVDNEQGDNKFGSLQFFTVKDNGEKETGSTLLFYGANSDSDITEYEYTLTVREGSNVYRGRVVRKDSAEKGTSVWYVKFFDLGNTDENTKKTISDVKFYDSKGNLVAVF